MRTSCGKSIGEKKNRNKRMNDILYSNKKYIQGRSQQLIMSSLSKLLSFIKSPKCYKTVSIITSQFCLMLLIPARATELMITTSHKSKFHLLIPLHTPGFPITTSHLICKIAYPKPTTYSPPHLFPLHLSPHTPRHSFR